MHKIESAHVQLGTRLLYNRCMRSPESVSELNPRPNTHRNPVIDRRLNSKHRADIGMYEESTYDVGWLTSDLPLLSAAVPMTPQTWWQWQKLSESVGEFEASVTTLSGPLWKAGAKWSRLLDLAHSPFIPHQIWQSILVEFPNGRVQCWSLILPNTTRTPGFALGLVATHQLENQLGYTLWQHLNDETFDKEKSKAKSRWW